MNYGDLKLLVQQWAHRSDAAFMAQMDTFKNNVEERICERFSYAVDPSLVNDLDTNDVLTNQPLLYQYGMLEEASLFIENAAAAQTYRQKWDDTAQRLNVTAGEWVGGATAPGKVQPYVPPETV